MIYKGEEMFNQEEFAKNQFIQERTNYECLAGKAADKIIHIAFNINDAFFYADGSNSNICSGK